jgi:hypothetical protein
MTSGQAGKRERCPRSIRLVPYRAVVPASTRAEVKAIPNLREFGLAVAIIALSLCPGCSLGDGGARSRSLVFVNPCPRGYEIALLDRLEGGKERAQFTAVPGVTSVGGVRWDEPTKDWAIRLDVPGGAVWQPFEGWFADGVVTIPALSCGT